MLRRHIQKVFRFVA